MTAASTAGADLAAAALGGAALSSGAPLGGPAATRKAPASTTPVATASLPVSATATVRGLGNLDPSAAPRTGNGVEHRRPAVDAWRAATKSRAASGPRRVQTRGVSPPLAPTPPASQPHPLPPIHKPPPGSHAPLSGCLFLMGMLSSRGSAYLTIAAFARLLSSCRLSTLDVLSLAVIHASFAGTRTWFTAPVPAEPPGGPGRKPRLAGPPGAMPMTCPRPDVEAPTEDLRGASARVWPAVCVSAQRGGGAGRWAGTTRRPNCT